jgi:hypothetical protein
MRNKINKEMLVLAGVKPVSTSQQIKRKVKKALFRVAASSLVTAAVVSGAFSSKASRRFLDLAWLLIQSER